VTHSDERERMADLKVTDILSDGVQAMHGLERMLDEMVPVMQEITRILADADIDMKALALRDAVEWRRSLP